MQSGYPGASGAISRWKCKTQAVLWFRYFHFLFCRSGPASVNAGTIFPHWQLSVVQTYLDMDPEEATRTCGRCHKDVAEANFALHETHCSRFLCLCPDCNEAVPKDQLSQHKEEQHTQVRCSECNQKMERCRLADHQSDECVERRECCHFCELELPWKQLDEHQLVCGSRTELCRDCGRYVTLRDQAKHGLTCSDTVNGSGPPQTTSEKTANNTTLTVNCGRCKASIPREEMVKHEWECVPADRSDDGEDEPEEEEEKEEENLYRGGATAASLSSAYKAASLTDRPSGGDPDQISTCPHCHLALPLFTLRWHEVKCQIHILLK